MLGLLDGYTFGPAQTKKQPRMAAWLQVIVRLNRQELVQASLDIPLSASSKISFRRLVSTMGLGNKKLKGEAKRAA